MKKQMAELPILRAPIKGETLIMYLSAAEKAISVVVVPGGDKQMPIYFVGRVLQSPEVNYTPMEKLILALVQAARRLRRTKKSGILAKWAIELGEHDISYQPRTSIRGQVLADFLAEIPTGEVNQVEEAATVATQETTE
ncbi:reverse transcriptase domain-containing protein, partial [Tanacetum coccineum]